MSLWVRQDPNSEIPQPISSVIAGLQRLAADLDQWDKWCGPDTIVALHDAVHAMQRAIFAAQELDAAAETPNFADQWIG